MKNFYGYLLTGWIFAVLSAWYGRDSDFVDSFSRRAAVFLAWMAAWPALLLVVLIAAIVRTRR